jgi:hypothetical protein
LRDACFHGEFLIAKSIAAVVPLAARVGLNDYRYLAGDARQIVDYLGATAGQFLVAMV